MFFGRGSTLNQPARSVAMASGYYDEKKGHPPGNALQEGVNYVTNKKNRKQVLVVAGIATILFFWSSLTGFSTPKV